MQNIMAVCLRSYSSLKLHEVFVGSINEWLLFMELEN